MAAFGLLVALALGERAVAAPFGTAFTYQGALRDAGEPASGSYDVQFTPYGVASGGAPLAAAVVVEDVLVEEGVFTARVDFGPAFFIGDEVFLEIAVRAGSSTGGFQQLLPRQELSAVPYAQKVRAGSVSAIELASGAVTGPSLGTDAVGAAAIAPNAVGTSELADGTVGVADLGTNSVGADEIASGAVGLDEIGTNAVGADEIASAAVGLDEIGPNAVDTGELLDGAVATAKLEDASVTRPKIAPGAIGANEVDPSVIQLRPTSTCPSGLPLLGFDASGAIFCSNAGRTIAAGISGDRGIELKLRSDDRPSLAYGFEAGLSFMACDDLLCTTGVQRLVATGLDVGATGSLVLNSNNFALISYVDSTADQLRLHVCSDTSCSSPATRMLADVGAISLPTSLGLAAGNPVIAYAGVNGAETEVRLYLCTSASCPVAGTIRILDTSAPNLDGLALAIRPSPSLRPLVAYAEAGGVGDRNLVLYDCADASCSSGTSRTIDGVATDSAGQDVSMAIRADGRPILAYHAPTGADLRIYDCADADCTSGTVRLGETVGTVGRAPSIAVRPDGRPLVTHNHSGAGLRLWDCADVNCTSGTARGLDGLDFAGQFGSALGVRSDGRPVIGYLASGGARTRVHVCGRTDCAVPP